MPPGLEEEFASQYQGRFLRAREVAQTVRKEARQLYIDMVAQLGVAPCGNRTFRQVLSKPGQASRWWYHRVAFKSCESDPTYEYIIWILTIQAIVQQEKIRQLVLVGAPSEVAAVLKIAFPVEEIDSQRPQRLWRLLLRGLASRVKWAIILTWQILKLRRHYAPPDQLYQVAIFGFWDWSVWWDAARRVLWDRYMARLPEELQQNGIVSAGWLAWLDPYGSGGKVKSVKELLAPLRGRNEVDILQGFLRPSEVFSAMANFAPLAIFLRTRSTLKFRKTFQQKGLDFYPLFAWPLFYGFLDANIPHCELIALATSKACRRHQPRVVLSFLEHFPAARALYEGVRQTGANTKCVNVQHASYNHEKTFLFLHPALEFQGQPDGCAVPHPDLVCALGPLGRELFLECGYSPEQVLSTGSPRYDYISGLAARTKPDPWEKDRPQNGHVRLLMVSSLSLDLEMEMLEAVNAATRGLNQIELYLRSHPMQPIERHPDFGRYRNYVELTRGSLEEDLARADLVLFTYSTVAEEAFLQGKPVWQWLPLKFNASALAEIASIPQFASVKGLRASLQEFLNNPQLPSDTMRQQAFDRLFYLVDGGSVTKITEIVRSLIN
ncbi:MAG: hypothetical protein ACOZFS_03115 [Thermodesulfobacteriota bacterium]